MKNHKIRDNECFTSSDIVSLYTNVPVKDSINVCANLLFDGKSSLSFLDKETFIELAEMACCNVIFDTFDGLYKQTDGLAMGIAHALCLANGWLSQFDTKTTSKRLRKCSSSDSDRDESQSNKKLFV